MHHSRLVETAFAHLFEVVALDIDSAGWVLDHIPADFVVESDWVAWDDHV